MYFLISTLGFFLCQICRNILYCPSTALSSVKFAAICIYLLKPVVLDLLEITPFASVYSKFLGAPITYISSSTLIFSQPPHLNPLQNNQSKKQKFYFVLNTRIELPIAIASPCRNTCWVVLIPFTAVPTGEPQSLITYLLPCITISQ